MLTRLRRVVKREKRADMTDMTAMVVAYRM
jgi:hypothetical protein